MAKIYFELTSDKQVRHHLAQLLRDTSFLHRSDTTPQPTPYPEASTFKSEERAEAERKGLVGSSPLMLEVEMSDAQALALLDKAAALHGGVVTDRKLADLSKKTEQAATEDGKAPKVSEPKVGTVGAVAASIKVAEKAEAKRK